MLLFTSWCTFSFLARKTMSILESTRRVRVVCWREYANITYGLWPDFFWKNPCPHRRWLSTSDSGFGMADQSTFFVTRFCLQPARSTNGSSQPRLFIDQFSHVIFTLVTPCRLLAVWCDALLLKPKVGEKAAWFYSALARECLSLSQSVESSIV